LPQGFPALGDKGKENKKSKIIIINKDSEGVYEIKLHFIFQRVLRNLLLPDTGVNRGYFTCFDPRYSTSQCADCPR
jgi:hypothetical protein